MGIFRDITERKQAQDQLDKYRLSMARAEQLASLGILSATVAHELTQPLTVLNLSIENALEKLKLTSSSKTIEENLNDCLYELSDIVSTIERFRNFGKRSSEQVLKEVNLETIGKRIMKLLDGSARQARIALRLKNMDKLPLVCLNEKDMEQLFFALVDNAIQASDCTKEHQVIVSGTAKDGQVELCFSDDCGGITPENLERIYEPFFTTKSANKGTGLGLCIVQDVVSRAGGKVRVESRFGRGSTFVVTLPINKVVRS
jgi:C4-dicarboxylate-specific signal transduction histidine kinase